jgi:radical SAM superfamily enzyme YgiQ (UPF0313 family)
MKVLLVFPKYPESFWSFKYALKFISAKAANPPLGLLTVANMLPEQWEKLLVDMNVHPLLSDEQIKWADYVLISAMSIQRASARQFIDRCRQLGVKTVAGGPLFTMEPEAFADVDHLVLGEAEVNLPVFLQDLADGHPKDIYQANQLPPLQTTPVPLWSLIKLKDYATMSIQYSRGCPFDCEFCDITSLFGHKPRLKNVEQMQLELTALYHHGWRGLIFIVDDNFIGNKVRLKRELLPAIIEWQQEHHRPFWFITEASINLADDEELMNLMHQAGFNSVFVGIETPSEEGLIECNKYNNVNRDLMASVKKLQNHGFQVSGGFIVGFDTDTPAIFQRQINFIQQSGIVTAMVGLLHAPVGTRLFERLKKERRLTANFSGDNTDLSINFIPKMNRQNLIDGYKKIVTTIYEPANYYERVLEFFKEFKPSKKKITMLRFCYIKALIKAMFLLGIIDKGRRYYWKLLFKTLFRYPRLLPEAVTFAIYGLHFRKIFALPNTRLENGD